jgi:peptidoglycan/xylan/chitin deacetylase (PgdA/CDA1 family)
MIKNVIKHITASKIIASLLNSVSVSNVVVLMYHDLCESDEDKNWIRLPGIRFEEHIRFLKEIGTMLSPTDLHEQLPTAGDKLKFLLTFDDGFVNHLRIALPILEKHDVPALFFITTENIETGEPFWFDKIITPIQFLKIKDLDLCHLGLNHYQFPDQNSSERWNSIQPLLSDIKNLSKSKNNVVSHVFEFLDERFGSRSREFFENIRPINHTEISLLIKSGQCHLGSHAHRHEILTHYGKKELLENLTRSKQILEDITGTRICHISYPNGDSNSLVETLAVQCGFQYGFGTKPGLFLQKTNRMRIPRIAVSGFDTPRILLWKINRELMKSTFRFVVRHQSLDSVYIRE